MGDCKSLLKEHLLGYGRCEKTGNECTCECLGRNIANNANHYDLSKQVVSITEENIQLAARVQELSDQIKHYSRLNNIQESNEMFQQQEEKIKKLEGDFALSQSVIRVHLSTISEQYEINKQLEAKVAELEKENRLVLQMRQVLYERDEVNVKKISELEAKVAELEEIIQGKKVWAVIDEKEQAEAEIKELKAFIKNQSDRSARTIQDYYDEDCRLREQLKICQQIAMEAEHKKGDLMLSIGLLNEENKKLRETLSSAIKMWCEYCHGSDCDMKCVMNDLKKLAKEGAWDAK